jgi:hypothetical protein
LIETSAGPQARTHANTSEFGSASVVSSGSGNIYIAGGFSPAPNPPSDNSNLPNRYANFVGREEEIDQVLTALASRAWIISIDGIGGIGKTTLALECAHLCKAGGRVAPHFDGFVWTSARDTPDFSLETLVSTVFSVLEPVERQADHDFGSSVARSRRLLAAVPILLIIDNFETVRDEKLFGFLRDFPSPSKVMITTRHHLQTGERIVTVGGLGETDSIKLLRQEADRLHVTLTDRDSILLKLIAQKAFGIPFVLRWVMESIYKGKSLNWALRSLENATADDIFKYIFERSLSLLDEEVHDVFRSFAFFPAWADIQTISALNPRVTALTDRLSALVSLSLVEDNRCLADNNRRYRISHFTRYMAVRQLKLRASDCAALLEIALNFYDSRLRQKTYSRERLEEEAENIRAVLLLASQFGGPACIRDAVKLASSIAPLDPTLANALAGETVGIIRDRGTPHLNVALLESLPNRYEIGSVVRDPQLFVGREELLSSIRMALETGSRAVWLVGPRRIGKTSIIYALERTAPSNIIYLPVQAFAIMSSDELYSQIARRLLQALHDRGAAPKRGPSRFTPKTVARLIEMALTGDASMRIVIAIDECDALANTPVGPTVFSYLRSLVQDGKVSLLLASGLPLMHMEGSCVSSPLFNIAIVKRVGVLDRRAVTALTQTPVDGLLSYSPSAFDRLMALTGGHPMFVQMICSSILAVCKERASLEVDEAIITSAVDSISDRVSEMYVAITSFRGSKVKSVAVGAAEVCNADGSFDVRRVLAHLQKSKDVDWTPSGCEEALKELAEDLIVIKRDERTWAFASETAHRALRSLGRYAT